MITKNASCIVALPRECNYATQAPNHATGHATTHATTDLKALANQVLARNRLCNSRATTQLHRVETNATEKMACATKLNEALVQNNLTLEELKFFLGEDFSAYQDNEEALILWVELLIEQRLMRQGEVPKRFAARTTCRYCGEIPIPPGQVNNGFVFGCPWCHVKISKNQLV